MITRLIALAVTLGLVVTAHASVWFSSIPSSAQSGSSYYVEASAYGGSFDLTIYKGGGYFAGGTYSPVGAYTTDYSTGQVNYMAELYDWYTMSYDYAYASVTITPANTQPTITWTQSPSSASVNQTITIQAKGTDGDGNLTNVRIWCNDSPFAFAGGGNGYEEYSTQNFSSGSPGSVYFMAEAMDGDGASSGFIYHTVSIYNDAPTIQWLNYPPLNPSTGFYEVFVNQIFTVQARGNDANGNLSSVSVWRNGVPFAFNGGGNGYQGDSDANTTYGTTNETITFKAVAGDSAGANSGDIYFYVKVINRVPTMTPTEITGPTVTWDSTYMHYRMWAQNSSISGSGTLTMSSTIDDADGNLVNHTLRYRQASAPDPQLWYLLCSDTASGSTSTKQVTLENVSTPGEWDFNAFGHDGIESHPGTSKTVWVYGETNAATFVSQSINGTPLTGASPSIALNSGALTATASIVLLNTGNKPWQNPDTAFGSPHRLGAIGIHHDRWGANRRDMTETWVDPQSFPSSDDTAHFNFSFPIPLTPGVYYFQWKMLEEGVAGDPFFETATPSVTVTVIDTTPPTAPSNLSASNIATTSFRLNWTAATDNGPVLSYDLYRTVSGVMTWMGNTTDTWWDFAGLSSGVTYGVKVVAKDGANPPLSADSATIQVTTAYDPAADNDGDGVTNGLEMELGLNPSDPGDVRVFLFDYDRIHQLVDGPGGTYAPDAEGNIEEVQP